jgi:hypothetical protein
VLLEPHEPLDRVVLGKAANQPFTMLLDALEQVGVTPV